MEGPSDNVTRRDSGDLAAAAGFREGISLPPSVSGDCQGYIYAELISIDLPLFRQDKGAEGNQNNAEVTSDSAAFEWWGISHEDLVNGVKLAPTDSIPSQCRASKRIAFPVRCCPTKFVNYLADMSTLPVWVETGGNFVGKADIHVVPWIRGEEGAYAIRVSGTFPVKKQAEFGDSVEIGSIRLRLWNDWLPQARMSVNRIASTLSSFERDELRAQLDGTLPLKPKPLPLRFSVVEGARTSQSRILGTSPSLSPPGRIRTRSPIDWDHKHSVSSAECATKMHIHAFSAPKLLHVHESEFSKRKTDVTVDDACQHSWAAQPDLSRPKPLYTSGAADKASNRFGRRSSRSASPAIDACGNPTVIPSRFLLEDRQWDLEGKTQRRDYPQVDQDGTRCMRGFTRAECFIRVQLCGLRLRGTSLRDLRITFRLDPRHEISEDVPSAHGALGARNWGDDDVCAVLSASGVSATPMWSDPRSSPSKGPPPRRIHVNLWRQTSLLGLAKVGVPEFSAQSAAQVVADGSALLVFHDVLVCSMVTGTTIGAVRVAVHAGFPAALGALKPMPQIVPPAAAIGDDGAIGNLAQINLPDRPSAMQANVISTEPCFWAPSAASALVALPQFQTQWQTFGQNQPESHTAAHTGPAQWAAPDVIAPTSSPPRTHLAKFPARPTSDRVFPPTQEYVFPCLPEAGRLLVSLACRVLGGVFIEDVTSSLNSAAMAIAAEQEKLWFGPTESGLPEEEEESRWLVEVVDFDPAGAATAVAAFARAGLLASTSAACVGLRSLSRQNCPDPPVSFAVRREAVQLLVASYCFGETPIPKTTHGGSCGSRETASDFESRLLSQIGHPREIAPHELFSSADVETCACLPSFVLFACLDMRGQRHCRAEDLSMFAENCLGFQPGKADLIASWCDPSRRGFVTYTSFRRFCGYLDGLCAPPVGGLTQWNQLRSDIRVALLAIGPRVSQTTTEVLVETRETEDVEHGLIWFLIAELKFPAIVAEMFASSVLKLRNRLGGEISMSASSLFDAFVRRSLAILSKHVEDLYAACLVAGLSIDDLTRSLRNCGKTGPGRVDLAPGCALWATLREVGVDVSRVNFEEIAHVLPAEAEFLRGYSAFLARHGAILGQLAASLAGS